MRLLPRILALLVCVLAPCSVAAAASPPGTLAQLAGAGGCVSAQAALGCTPARGLDDARAVALSPDGRSLYVAAATPASVTAFSVAPGNGLLAQLNLGAGCLASVAQDGCGGARALEGASAIAVSPDNLHVYVASATAGAVASFARQPNGSLVQLNGIAGCIVDDCNGRLRDGPAAGRRRRDRDLARRPLRLRRRRHRRCAHRVLARRRHRTADAAPGGRRVPARQSRANCTPVTGIDGPSSIAITPDGTSLYVTSASAGTLTAFQRDVDTGSARRSSAPASAA